MIILGIEIFLLDYHCFRDRMYGFNIDRKFSTNEYRPFRSFMFILFGLSGHCLLLIQCICLDLKSLDKKQVLNG